MKRGRDGRFLPGYSGNGGGRPRKQAASDHMFDAIFSKPMVIKQNGIEKEMIGGDVMLLRTVELAMKRGSGPRAVRIVCKAMIARCAASLEQADRKPSKPKLIFIRERDSDNAFDAMCVLGIAVPRPDYPQQGNPGEIGPNGEEIPVDYHRIVLVPWAVEEARSYKSDPPDDPDFSIRIAHHTATPELPK